MRYVLLTPVIQINQQDSGIEIRIFHGVFQNFVALRLSATHVFYSCYAYFIERCIDKGRISPVTTISQSKVKHPVNVLRQQILNMHR